MGAFIMPNYAPTMALRPPASLPNPTSLVPHTHPALCMPHANHETKSSLGITYQVHEMDFLGVTKSASRDLLGCKKFLISNNQLFRRGDETRLSK